MDTDQGHVATGQDRASVMDTGEDRAPTTDTDQGRVDTGQNRASNMVTAEDRAPTMDTGQGRMATDTDQDHAPVMDLDQGPTPTLDMGQRSVTMDTNLRLITRTPLGPQSVRRKVMWLSRRDERRCLRRLLVSDNPRAHDRYCCLCGGYFQAENALATCTFRGAVQLPHIWKNISGSQFGHVMNVRSAIP
jgi:hypothetical protein